VITAAQHRQLYHEPAFYKLVDHLGQLRVGAGSVYDPGSGPAQLLLCARPTQGRAKEGQGFPGSRGALNQCVLGVVETLDELGTGGDTYETICFWQS
jgi:hypothetical protein